LAQVFSISTVYVVWLDFNFGVFVCVWLVVVLVLWVDLGFVSCKLGLFGCCLLRRSAACAFLLVCAVEVENLLLGENYTPINKETI
jgi:hypothetical protein